MARLLLGTGLAFFVEGIIIMPMARQRRFEYPGGIYYIRARGVENEIFKDESDRKRFLDILSETVYRFKWLCHSYCLLNDHYHLILETPYGNLSKGMRQINGLYTQSFNRKYRRRGALFKGRFKSVVFEKKGYLLPLNRHLVLNPVRSGLVGSPDRWRWSSYLPTVEEEEAPPFLFTGFILSLFSKENRALAIEKYKRFIFSGEAEKFSWRDLKFQIFLGSDFFIEKIRQMFMVHKVPKRDRRSLSENGVREVLDPLLGRGWTSRKDRDALIYEAYIHHGLTLGEIAAYLGVHTATVSRAVKRVERRNSWVKKRMGGQVWVK